MTENELITVHKAALEFACSYRCGFLYAYSIGANLRSPFIKSHCYKQTNERKKNLDCKKKYSSPSRFLEELIKNIHNKSLQAERLYPITTRCCVLSFQIGTHTSLSKSP